MPRYVCIHGHFYQPPRENPWLEIVEPQETAAPWHDWNDRITAECYRRNTASRILDKEGNIRKICNNYSRMSFNIGPTLMSWLKENAPRCYRGILNADLEGMERFSGHGPALAQVYSHLIMPLANRRDKVTQVKWGIADFKSRFGRMPEGMWLAETAVDTETLEVLAENGICFTILAPNQASEIRPLGGGAWQDVKWGRIDPGAAYRCNLPSGNSIDLFFYDGAVSHDIAFGGLLNDGGAYAARLIEARPDGPGATLSHVATDGESYGHHHRHGDMALAYCLETIEKSTARLTIYGEFLEKFPPAHEVRIVEKSAWSCAHGVERWRSDCGCSGGTPGYHQRWRAPLRNALDWLRDKLAVQFEYEGEQYLKSPWQARDDYISLILDRSAGAEQWLDAHASRELSEEDKVKVMELMESQRAALLMFTSCGWFFDEISGLETTQILRYALRAISLIRGLTGMDFENEFARMLEKAESNVPEFKNGRRVYELLVKPSQVSFERLAAHYGMSALFPGQTRDTWEKELSGGCWKAEGGDTVLETSPGVDGSLIFATGKVSVSSKITGDKKNFAFAANYRGETAVVCGITPFKEQEPSTLSDLRSLRAAFAMSNDKFLIEMFGHNFFSFRHILPYVQRVMLGKILEQDMESIKNSIDSIVSDYYELFEYLATMNVKAPSIICSAAGITLTANVERALAEEVPDIDAIRKNLKHSRDWNVPVDREQVERALKAWFAKQMLDIYEFAELPAARMDMVGDVITFFTSELGWSWDMYEAQNLYFATQKSIAANSPHLIPEALDSFRRLGGILKFADDALTVRV